MNQEATQEVRPSKSLPENAFTLIELLVVIRNTLLAIIN